MYIHDNVTSIWNFSLPNNMKFVPLTWNWLYWKYTLRSHLNIRKLVFIHQSKISSENSYLNSMPVKLLQLIRNKVINNMLKTISLTIILWICDLNLIKRIEWKRQEIYLEILSDNIIEAKRRSKISKIEDWRRRSQSSNSHMWVLQPKPSR